MIHCISTESAAASNLFLQCIYRTDEELKFRWKMLSDIQLRTREVALSLYAFPSPNRYGTSNVLILNERYPSQ